MLNTEQSLLVVIDVQGRLAAMMHDPRYLQRVKGLMKAAKILGVPVVLTEQAPEKIGAVIDEIRALAPDVTPIVKQTFSCWGETFFEQAIRSSGRKQILVAGIEAHVCVYQTVRDLSKEHYEVYLVVDAVSARHPVDDQIGVHRCQKDGAVLTTLEMTVTELMRSTSHPKFREVMALLKENK
jgi:nicotinamidase-related amidase